MFSEPPNPAPEGEEQKFDPEGEGEREEATTDAMEEASPSRCCRTRRLSG